MFSPAKLLLLLILIGVVCIGFRYTSRVDAIRRGLREELKRRQEAQRPRKIEAEDLVKCTRCDAYVAARDPTPCSRADCPWRR